MKLALIMNKNSYAGREYLSKLCNKIKIDVIEIGDYPDIDDEEEKRCGGLWKPIKTEDLKHHFNFYNFESLDSSDLENFLEFDGGLLPQVFKAEVLQ